MLAVVAAKAVDAAGNGGEDVVRVHGAEDEVRPVPLDQTVLAVEGDVPALEAAHADGVHVQHPALEVHRHRRLVVLSRREEKGSVDQWVSVEDYHRALTQHAGHPVEGIKEIEIGGKLRHIACKSADYAEYVWSMCACVLLGERSERCTCL